MMLDDGILVGELGISNLRIPKDMLNNTPLWPLVQIRREVRQARPDQSAGHAKLKSSQFYLFSMSLYKKHLFICFQCLCTRNIYILPFVCDVLGAVARVNWVI